MKWELFEFFPRVEELSAISRIVSFDINGDPSNMTPRCGKLEWEDGTIFERLKSSWNTGALLDRAQFPNQRRLYAVGRFRLVLTISGIGPYVRWSTPNSSSS